MDMTLKVDNSDNCETIQELDSSQLSLIGGGTGDISLGKTER